MQDQNLNNLTDENVLLLLHEFAKVDPVAHQLLKDIVKTKDYGEHDILLSKAHYYLKENNKCLN